MIAHRAQHYHTMNFILQYSTNSGENSVGAHTGADTVRVSKCGMCWIMWTHDMCQNETRGVSSRYRSVEHQCRSSRCHDMWSVTCQDVWTQRQTMMTCGYECLDIWVAWGGWQTWEEGCLDAGTCGDGGIQMCLAQGVTVRGCPLGPPTIIDSLRYSQSLTKSSKVLQTSLKPCKHPQSTLDLDYNNPELPWLMGHHHEGRQVVIHEVDMSSAS